MEVTATKKDTGLQSAAFAVITLLMIVVTAILLQQFLFLCDADDRVHAWIPGELTLAFAAPTFALCSVIGCWIAATKGTGYKKLFKVSGIISIMLYACWTALCLFTIALGHAFAH